MSEFFMRQPETAETDAVQEDVHQRVPNNYRLWALHRSQVGIRVAERSHHPRHGDKSVKRSLFFHLFLQGKQPPFLSRLYIRS